MNEIQKLLTKQEGNRVLFVFPHLDDCAFVAGGLLQTANKLGLKTYVGVLVENENLQGNQEFLKYSKQLEVTEAVIIKTTHGALKNNLEKLLKKINPQVVVTFDPAGITGNSHHTLLSLKLYEIVSELNKKPKLLWRVADHEEEKYFGKMPNVLGRPYSDVIKLKLSFIHSIKKIKAILANQSRMKGFLYKLRIIEWYLFDHSEYYYLVDFAKDHLKVNFQQK